MKTNPDSHDPNKPNWRMPFGTLLILFLVLVWCAIIVSLVDQISMLKFWLQFPIYAIAGIVWIFPIKLILIWMNTGKFRQ